MAIIYRKILAGLSALIILFGTTGFVLQEHNCMHCGIELSILIHSESSDNSVCCGDAPVKSCYKEETDTDFIQASKECVDAKADCCSYEFVQYSVDEVFLFIDHDILSEPVLPTQIMIIICSDSSESIFETKGKALYHSGKAINIKNSQFLI